MMGWYYDGVGWGGWLVMLVGMVAFWGLVVWVVIALFRDNRSIDDRPVRRDPLRTLDERFALGEIDESEYRARVDVLRAATSRSRA